MSEQQSLFATSAETSEACSFPSHAAATAYAYGCRCERCRAAKAHQRKGPGPTCGHDGCDGSRLKHRRYCEAHAPRCAEAGCQNPRRLVSGARYCDEHATSVDYVLLDRSPRPDMQRCGRCLQSFNVKRRLRSALSMVWHEFCADCRDETPLTYERLRHHHVPPEVARMWLRLGPDLPCGLCGRILRRKGGSAIPTIDHDHICCRGEASCGKCVRAVLCNECNVKVGTVETLVRDGQLDRILAYMDKNPANGAVFQVVDSK